MEKLASCVDRWIPETSMDFSVCPSSFALFQYRNVLSSADGKISLFAQRYRPSFFLREVVCLLLVNCSQVQVYVVELEVDEVGMQWHSPIAKLLNGKMLFVQTITLLRSFSILGGKYVKPAKCKVYREKLACCKVILVA